MPMSLFLYFIKKIKFKKIIQKNNFLENGYSKNLKKRKF